VLSGKATSRLSRAALLDQWRQVHALLCHVKSLDQQNDSTEGPGEQQHESIVAGDGVLSKEQYVQLKWRIGRTYMDHWTRLRNGPGLFTSWINK
jgi:hypothetical protein